MNFHVVMIWQFFYETTFVLTLLFVKHTIPKQRRNYEVKRFCVETITFISLTLMVLLKLNDDHL